MRLLLLLQYYLHNSTQTISHILDCFIVVKPKAKAKQRMSKSDFKWQQEHPTFPMMQLKCKCLLLHTYSLLSSLLAVFSLNQDNTE